MFYVLAYNRSKISTSRKKLCLDFENGFSRIRTHIRPLPFFTQQQKSTWIYQCLFIFSNDVRPVFVLAHTLSGQSDQILHRRKKIIVLFEEGNYYYREIFNLFLKAPGTSVCQNTDLEVPYLSFNHILFPCETPQATYIVINDNKWFNIKESDST